MDLCSYENDKTKEIKNEFESKIKKIWFKEKKQREYIDMVFLCIGTDRMTGDCLGPIVGTKLKNKIERQNISNINVYGTLDKNVSYTNIEDTLKIINQRHKNAYIISVDSALSNKENIGKVFIKEGKMELGKCLNKKKIEVGNISISGVVGKNYKIPKYNFNILQNISLNEVLKLANVVYKGIIEAINIMYN